jgi:hypothetical protein
MSAKQSTTATAAAIFMPAKQSTATAMSAEQSAAATLLRAQF